MLHVMEVVIFLGWAQILVLDNRNAEGGLY